MSHLHRFYAGNAGSVWELEGRWMRDAGTFRAPAAVQWMATRACDLTCSHCYSEAGPRLSTELDTSEALALVDRIADMGCDQLVIAGGEPLLRRDLDRVVARAAERGVRWALHTHGGLVEARAALFHDHPPSMVAVSLDGPAELHDRLRGREGSHRDALRALRWLADHTSCPQVVVGTVVNRLNADRLADMEADVRASGASSWGLHLFAPEGRGASHRALFPTAGQLQRAAAFARRKRSALHVELDNEWGSAGPLDPFYRDHPFLCGAGRFTVVVGADGAIAPCTTTDPDEAEGNVRTHDLREVWRTGFARFRGDGSDAACADGADCWLQTRNGMSARADAFGVSVPHRAVVAGLSAARTLPRPSGALRWAAVAALAASTGAAQAAEGCAEVPGFPSESQIQTWARGRASTLEGLQGRSAWADLKAAVVDGRAPRSTALPAVADVLVRTERRPADVVLAALDEAEAAGVWDAWLVGRLWQRTEADPADAANRRVLARLEHHARVASTLALGLASAGPVRFQPWMSKAARPSDHVEVLLPDGLAEAARAAFPSTDAGTWRSEVTLDVRVEGGRATLCRQGALTELEPGASLRLGRLDTVMLAEGATLVHARLGRIAGSGWVGAGSFVREAPPEVLTRVDAALTSGKAGDIDAVASVLLLAAPTVRRAVGDRPEAPGAAALRQLLVLYDE
ncbi:MAG: radical SAM protein [Myxococcota bacterium]